jgi:hypothetical protein
VKRKTASIKRREKTDWQTGDLKSYSSFSFNIPQQFLMLCRLMRVTPQQLLADFMDNLSCSTANREGRDAAKQHLINYFLDHGYGNREYSREEILSIFKELDAIGLLYPSRGSEKIIQAHLQWRENYWEYWLSRWMRS